MRSVPLVTNGDRTWAERPIRALPDVARTRPARGVRWMAAPGVRQDDPVPTRLPSLRRPPIGFAHRGARAHAPENTIESFQLALRLGATGLESDVWLSADGQALLDHDGFVGGRLRRKPIRSVTREQIPAAVPSLGELYEACGTDVELSLDIKDPAAITEVILVARDAGAEEHLWLCHPDLDLVASWRELSPRVHLVNSTRLSRLKDGPERRAADLKDAGIDAINLHHNDWSGGLITLFHRFGIFTLGWDAQFPRTLDALLEAGIDGVYSDHTDLMMAAIGRVG